MVYWKADGISKHKIRLRIWQDQEQASFDQRNIQILLCFWVGHYFFCGLWIIFSAVLFGALMGLGSSGPRLSSRMCWFWLCGVWDCKQCVYVYAFGQWKISKCACVFTPPQTTSRANHLTLKNRQDSGTCVTTWARHVNNKMLNY